MKLVQKIRLTIQGWPIGTKLLVLTLSLIAAVTVVAAWAMHVRNAAALQSKLMQQARSLHTQIIADREYYASVIVPRLVELGGSLGADYRQVHGRFPLPVTFVREVSALTAAAQESYTANLISPWAINKDKGLKDQFQRDAFAYLAEHPSGEFFRTDTIGSQTVMRFLMADRASAPSCVGCHNAHPQSPRHDFKLNDLMGGLEIVIPMDRYMRENQRVLALTIAGGAGLFLLILGIVTRGTRVLVTQPLARLTDTMRSVAGTGEPSTHAVPPSTGDEVAQLTHAFKQMQVVILAQQEQLRDANASLEQRVVERTQALQASEARFRSVAQSAHDAIIAADSRGKILSWNAGARTIFGYEEEAMLGKPLTVLMPERFREAHQAGLKRLVSKGEPHVIGKVVELAGLRKDGSEFPLELSLAAWETPEGLFFTGIIRDITERKLAEERLNWLKEYTETILHSVPNPIIIIGQDEHVEYMNTAAKQALRPRNGGESGIKLFDLFRADDTTLEQLRRGLGAYEGGMEGGHAAPHASRPRPVTARDPLAPRAAADEHQSRKELKIGSSAYQYAWFHFNARSGEGKRIGLVLRDTTEESRMHDQLILAEKWASLGVLSSGIGHELNNPLYVVMGLSEAILDERDAAPMKEHAKDIVGEAKRMAKIIQDFTGHARTETNDPPIELDLNEQLDWALKMVRLMGGVDGLEVQRDYAPLPRMKAKPEEIQQVFSNIMTNGVQAMKGHGTLHLATTATEEAITVRIRDSGPGIPKAYASKVFDPFFTTKGQGEGRGLGLTIAHRIVTKYGGHIQVETEEGQGATFILTFPVPGAAP